MHWRAVQTSCTYCNEIRTISEIITSDGSSYFPQCPNCPCRTTAYEDDFKKRGLVLEQLLIRNINLPTSVKTTIESKINAEQDAQKMQFVLQKEKQEAERKRVEAQGIADYQKILSTGLSDKQLQYESIIAQKELAKSPNAKVIIMGSSKGTPIILGNN